MKKFKPFLIIATALCLFVAVLAGCSNTTKGGSATGSSDIHISEPTFGFITAESYKKATDENLFTKDMLSKRADLDVDTEYRLFINFTVTAMRNNDGQSLLNVKFTFESLDNLEGRMTDVSTGRIQDMEFTDATSGNRGRTTTLSFSVPPLASEPKEIEMIVSLTPVTVGESLIIFAFDYDEDGYRLTGSDGNTKNLTIQKVKIDTPKLEYNANDAVLLWSHLKNADYYCFFISGYLNNPILGWHSDEPYYYIPREGSSVGSQQSLALEMLDLDRGGQTLVIMAFSNNTDNIDNSDPSNYVRVNV